MSDKIRYFNPNDGLTGRDGGPYLDLEQARIKEERSAKLEGRSPRHGDNAGGVGIQLQPEEYVRDARSFPVSQRDSDWSLIEDHFTKPVVEVPKKATVSDSPFPADTTNEKPVDTAKGDDELDSL